MSVYKIDIQKSIGSEFWTNVYYVNVPDLATATTNGEDIVAIEQAVHRSGVIFDKMLVTDLETDFFSSVPLSGTGELPYSSDTLPLWNVARVDFAVTGMRPGRKFLRLPVQEDEQNAGILTGATITRLVDNYAVPLRNLGVLSNERGDAFNAITVNPNVAMRQLRRGSKRRVTPVI